MRHTTSLAIVLMTLLTLSACRNDGNRNTGSTGAGAGAPPERSGLTGTLQSGAVAIGGETTGWRLIGDGQTGGIDVDVSKVRDRAKALDGKRVTITGRMADREWPERGKVQVLVAEKIEEAEQKKPE